MSTSPAAIAAPQKPSKAGARAEVSSANMPAPSFTRIFGSKPKAPASTRSRSPSLSMSTRSPSRYQPGSSSSRAAVSSVKTPVPSLMYSRDWCAGASTAGAL